MDHTSTIAAAPAPGMNASPWNAAIRGLKVGRHARYRRTDVDTRLNTLSHGGERS